LETIDRDLRVRPDRWIVARLAAVFAAAPADVQQQMTAALEADFVETLDRDTPAGYRQFVNRYGFHPLADRARLALAAKLLSADQYLEAELLASPLQQSTDRQTAGQAAAILAEVYEKAKRPELSAASYQRL